MIVAYNHSVIKFISAEVLILCEQVVKHTKGGFEVKINNIFRSRFGLRKSSVQHQLEGKANVVYFFLKHLQSVP